MNGPQGTDASMGTVLPFTGLPFFQEVVVGAQPAAGAAFTLSNDPRYRSLLTSCVVTLATSAVVATRLLSLHYEDAGGNVYGRTGGNYSQAAGSTRRVSFGLLRGSAEANPGSDQFAPLVPILLYGSDQIALRVVNIDVGDQLSAIRLVFLRWPEAWPDSPQPGEGRVSPA